MSATSYAVSLIMLCTEAIYSLCVNIEALHAAMAEAFLKWGGGPKPMVRFFRLQPGPAVA